LIAQVQEIAMDYYKRIEPRDAAVLVKQLTHNSTAVDGTA
jgi:hypothetical protein